MRDKIRLNCSGECGAFYTTDKNKRKTTDKLEMKKFCPKCHKHTAHKEGKIK